jgi:hypothetical protein
MYISSLLLSWYGYSQGVLVFTSYSLPTLLAALVFSLLFGGLQVCIVCWTAAEAGLEQRRGGGTSPQVFSNI